MLIRVLPVIALLVSSSAFAQSFDVQIGAFRNPDVAQIKLPANVGELRSTSGPNGLTRFVVGPFFARADAEQARDRLQAAGFNGAFVRATRDTRVETSQPASEIVYQPASVTSYNNSSTAEQRDMDKWLSLSEEQRRDLVFLDGRLHRKVGDEFIPYRD